MPETPDEEYQSMLKMFYRFQKDAVITLARCRQCRQIINPADRLSHYRMHKEESNA